MICRLRLGFWWHQGKFWQINLEQYEFAGELALSGKLRPIRGAFAMAWQGQQAGHAFVLPNENAQQVAIMSHIEAYGADSLAAIVRI